MFFTLMVIGCKVLPPPREINHKTLLPNGRVYGDSISRVIASPTKIRAYQMTRYLPDSSTPLPSDSLFGYGIRKSIGDLTPEQASVTSFIFSDSLMYIKNYPPVRQDFIPNIALEFQKYEAKVFILLSFGSEEMFVYDEKGSYTKYHMNDQRQIARWAHYLLPDNEFYKILINR